MIGLDPRSLRVAWTIFLFGLFLAFLYAAHRVLVIFALALFLSLLLSPLVGVIDRYTPRRISRTASLALIYVVLIGIAVAILVPIGTTIADEAKGLGSHVPTTIRENPLASMRLPSWLEPLRNQLASALQDRLDDIGQNAVPLLGKAFGGLLTGLGAIVSAILIPILAFFFVKDGRKIRDGILHSIPRHHRRVVGDIATDLRVILSQYLRALLVLAAVTFVAYSAFLSFTGAPYAILLAGIAGVLEFVPAVGPFLAAVSIVIAGLFNGYSHWILLIVFLALYRLAQDYVLQPALMSAGVQLHPLLVVFGALAGGEIGGVPGVFFSVPVMAALRVIVTRLVREEQLEQTSEAEQESKAF